ncbi:MAG TPA: carboxypeptidase-like regulatory domain-containing protein, partial [Edaphobacter sp.]|nr:carboxypeptidase-like regulatory domain-containing protein [Edaphobacter sp.]
MDGEIYFRNQLIRRYLPQRYVLQYGLHCSRARTCGNTRVADGLLIEEGLDAMKMSFIRMLVGSLTAVFLWGTPGRAQTVTGAVTGTVTDPSGAVVPGATVVAINVATTVRTPATTNSSGVYSIRFLPIGN